LARILISPQPAVISPWNKKRAKNENEKQQSAKISENQAW
jgi:hypothetical protein